MLSNPPRKTHASTHGDMSGVPFWGLGGAGPLTTSPASCILVNVEHLFRSDERHAVSIRSNARSIPLSKHAARRKTPRLCCKAYKFRLYPTKKQVDKLAWTLRRCKELYNAALQERREAYLCWLLGTSVQKTDSLRTIIPAAL
jgi:hypothetical protein